MGIPGSASPLLLVSAAAAPTAYTISRSLRFNSSDSAFCSRVFSSAGNRKTFTYSAWIKRNKLGAYGRLLAAGTGTSDATYFALNFRNSDIISVEGVGTAWRLTTQVFRDPGAWMHVLLAIDTTLAVASDRIKLYVNGSQITTFSASNDPTQNYDFVVNSNVEHMLGADKYNNSYSYYSDFQLADVHFIDGQALDPTSFGEFDEYNNWQPKAYTGSYGTNGFHLPFSDNSTAAALGTDTSGNSNTWTVNNISVAAGAGNDSLVDTPTSYGTDTGAGGEVRGNYCTWNPLNLSPSGLITVNGNLDVSGSVSGGGANAHGTVGCAAGKWYYEVTAGATTSDLYIGWVDSGGTLWNMYRPDGKIYANGVGPSAYGASWTTNDVIGVALDLTNGTVVFYKNGVSQGTAATGVNTTLTWFPFFRLYSSGSASLTTPSSANFGQRPFAYTAPSGFKALCTANLDEPTVPDGSTAMDVVTYTGNGSTQTISGLGFSPDLVWTKMRSTTGYSHKLVDQVRGATKSLVSNNTNAELTETSGLTAFTSDGFSLGSQDAYNRNNDTFVAWTWDAGSSTVSNTDGSITGGAQVRANPSSGFSVITTNGNSSSTIGHGLNVAPSFIIGKDRDTGGTNWVVYHKALGATKFLILNGTGSTITDSGVWGGTEPTSSVFSVGSYISGSFVWYAFSPVDGYSSFGSYTGNGSTDGPFVYTGMRPRWVLIKVTNTSDSWLLYDSARSSYNVVDDFLQPNNSEAEATGNSNALDFLSNGFKLKGSVGGTNGNGNTYIYAAFAEHPFRTSRAR